MQAAIARIQNHTFIWWTSLSVPYLACVHYNGDVPRANPFPGRKSARASSLFAGEIGSHLFGHELRARDAQDLKPCSASGGDA